MLGVILDAIGVPAAALQIAAPGRLVVRAANDALAGLLGCGRSELPGTDAGYALPRRPW